MGKIVVYILWMAMVTISVTSSPLQKFDWLTRRNIVQMGIYNQRVAKIDQIITENAYTKNKK